MIWSVNKMQKLIHKEKVQGVLKRIKIGNAGGIALAFFILCIALSFASPVFLTVENLMIVARQAVFVLIIGLSMTFVIATGGIDLSVGAILALTGVIVARLLLLGYSVWLVISVGLILGATLGFINGILIAGIGMADFIATLGMLSIIRGVVMLLTRGVPIFGLQFRSFQFLAQGFVGPIPFPIIITILLLIICLFILERTRFGRYVIATGSNREAAVLVGINIRKIKIMVYTMSGIFSAISAILLTSRMEAAMPEAGSGWELDVIAATVIGGTSLAGGNASLIGTVLGALVMAVVRNGLNLLSVNVFWHQVVIGVIILLAVAMDTLQLKRKE
jgi:ribose transport system permease protein